eukprot:SAG31_NODE_30459_length_381_cov_0.553191_1_plen_46_part_10
MLVELTRTKAITPVLPTCLLHRSASRGSRLQRAQFAYPAAGIFFAL